MPDRTAALRHYDQARNWIVRSSFYMEPIAQQMASYEHVTERTLLREHAWVTLNSGFRESVVRERFDYISLCFCDWESAASIVAAGDACVLAAGSVFRNQRKLRGILGAAQLIQKVGFAAFAARMQAQPIATLRHLPYMGEITSIHLGKNLGLNVVKPDRHLVRLADRFGYQGPVEMCKELADITGDQENVVDLVLWRFEQQSFDRPSRADGSKSVARFGQS